MDRYHKPETTYQTIQQFNRDIMARVAADP